MDPLPPGGGEGGNGDGNINNNVVVINNNNNTKGMCGDIPLPAGVNPQTFGQLKFTSLQAQQQLNTQQLQQQQQSQGGAAGTATAAAADIDFDFNILANYLAEEVQYGKGAEANNGVRGGRVHVSFVWKVSHGT